MITADEIREKVKTIIQLPVLPTLAMEVVDMVENPRTSASQLGKVISTDQALTGKVLKIANSPFYGFPKKISTVDFAIIVLGFDALKEIVISISLISSLQKRSDAYFDSKQFWDHAITTGVIARRLGRDTKYRVSGEVFVGGLLHDMGISVMHRNFPNEFKRIVDITRETELSFIEAEESVLGVTHAEIGGWLAERWNLPESLCEAVAAHHHPERASKNMDLVSLIHVADLIGQKLQSGQNEFDKGSEFSPEALKQLGMEDQSALDEKIDEYRRVIQADMEELTRRSSAHAGLEAS
jgi:HD-like signal output (HDOD) protein